MTKNVTISISDELGRKMDAMPEINWSEVCRQCISKYIDKRREEKGELLKGLEESLKTKLPEKESVRKAEVERFTKKWGKPDSAYNLLVKAPYIGLSKKQTVEYGDWKIADLEIENDRDLRFTLKDFNPELYNEKIKAIVDYFKSKGFDCGETYLNQPQVINYVTHGDKNFARDRLSKGYHYYGLFAQDKEDRVFIAYREVKPK